MKEGERKKKGRRRRRGGRWAGDIKGTWIRMTLGCLGLRMDAKEPGETLFLWMS